jgi:hypothetical protein
LSENPENDLLNIIEEIESFSIPKKFARFLYREEPPSTADNTTNLYAFSYERAFEELTSAARAHWHNGILRAPLFYLARHSIELHLKSAIEDFANYTGEDIKDCGHNLLDLWRELQRLQFDVAGLPGKGDEWGTHVEKLINHIHAIDPTGEAFRYPENRAGKKFDYTRVELDGLVKAHHHITSYCSASMDYLSEFANAY